MHHSYKIKFPGERCSFSSRWSQKISNKSSTAKGRKLKHKIIWQLWKLEMEQNKRGTAAQYGKKTEAEGQKAAGKVWVLGALAGNGTGTS